MFAYLYVHVHIYLSFNDAILGEGVILDRSVFSDYVFARVGYNQGFISEEGMLPALTTYEYYFLSLSSLVNSPQSH